MSDVKVIPITPKYREHYDEINWHKEDKKKVVLSDELKKEWEEFELKEEWETLLALNKDSLEKVVKNMENNLTIT